MDSRTPNTEPGSAVGPGRRRHDLGSAAKTLILASALAVAGVALTAGQGLADASVFDPAGPRAARIANLGWVMIALAVVIFFIVLVFLIGAIARSRRRDGDRPPQTNEGRGPLLVGIALSALVLLGLFAYTLWSLRSLAAPAQAADLTIEVVGNQWWWQVTYPDAGVVTANELHIPVGKPVAIELTSDDVIHSFWVPRLSGKTDLNPGSTNTIWLQADQPGTYRGECAEFCGIEHALMQFLVVAEPDDQYQAWLAAQQAPAGVPPADSLLAEGQQLFLGSACVYCHTVRGTNATGQLGPDLTHLASRRTIAAGTLDNNVGNLEAWIVDPQAIKPGNRMPGFDFNADELQALVAYLESLD
jgi:cytochrome c oxidase subunit 2